MSASLSVDIEGARARRLGTIREIVESCGTDRIHIDVVTEVMMEALLELGPDPDRPVPADEELERSIMCAVATVTSALRSLTWYLAERLQPGRNRRLLEELPDRMIRLVDDAMAPRLAALPRKQIAEIMLESCRWAYVILSPAEQRVLLGILERTAAGSKPLAEQRQRAGEFLERFKASWPMGEQHGEGASNK